MSDMHDKRTRSYSMSRIASKNTKPELRVHRFLFACGLHYRLHDKMLIGKPDQCLRTFRSVIFVNRFFWHGQTNYKYFVTPKKKSEWRAKKKVSNVVRDEQIIRESQEHYWKILFVWQYELKTIMTDTILTDLLNRTFKLEKSNAQ